ncbi:substrate-binding domain-containing protein [Streptomyces sp. GMR22]|uniref:substrate-binding domain-containing protein n=1 Tax=Streptomyces sp. GMR22 TaxID=2759524 RepID=UPI0015FAB9D2|nr:substrate-binding domain-containing protein [Streptomyces sp. GMR22]MBA6434477.1 substrate-binding domain-containing protein [Streptomyces sp. GMR22]
MDRSPRVRKTQATTLVAACTAGILLVTGCTSSTGGKNAETASNGLVAGRAKTPRMTIAMVTHGVAGDPFWDVVRKGAETAAAKDNVKLVYSSDPTASNQANLVRNAINQKVDGLAITLATPDSMRGVVAKAKAAGIPVTVFDQGMDYWKKMGAIGYFGADERLAGEMVGKRLNAMGAKHDLCLIHAQGTVALEARCAGVKSTFKGKTDTLYVNGQDMSSVQSTLTAKLRQDPSIDQVTTLQATIGSTALSSVEGANSKAKVNTFDLNKDVAAAIKKGSIEFSVDHQPYLEGYEAVDALWLYKVNGNTIGGGRPTLTGPAFVDKSNIAKVYQYAQNGTR